MMTSTLRRRSSEMTGTMLRQTSTLSSAMVLSMRRGSTTTSLNGTIPEGEECERGIPARTASTAPDTVKRSSSRKLRFWMGSASNKITSEDTDSQPPRGQGDSLESERRALAESPGSSNHASGSTPGSTPGSMMSSTPGSMPGGKQRSTWEMWRSSSANAKAVSAGNVGALSEGGENSYRRVETLNRNATTESMTSFGSMDMDSSFKSAGSNDMPPEQRKKTKKLRMRKRRRRRQKLIDNATWRKGIWGRRLAIVSAKFLFIFNSNFFPKSLDKALGTTTIH